MTVLALAAALLAPTACSAIDGSGTTDSSANGGIEGVDDSVTDGDGDTEAQGSAVAPPCPFTAEQVSDLVGQSMEDQGNCLFGDGKGVASLTITMASATAGEVTYDYQRDQAGKTYANVSDLGKGTKSYLAIKDIGAEAVLISDQGAYTVTMSSFSFDTAQYDQTMRALIDAILA